MKAASVPSVGASVQRTTVSAGEVRLHCPLDPPCDWQTVRPEYAAGSAVKAHVIRHQRGTL